MCLVKLLGVRLAVGLGQADANQSRAEVRSAIHRISLLLGFLPRFRLRQLAESPFCNVVGSTHLWFSECPSMKERLNAPLWNAAGKSIHPTLAVA